MSVEIKTTDYLIEIEYPGRIVSILLLETHEYQYIVQFDDSDQQILFYAKRKFSINQKVTVMPLQLTKH